MNFKNKEIKVLKGYVSNNIFGPYSLPVKQQNQILRYYCEQKKKIYALPHAEPIFSRTFIQLKSLIIDLKCNEGVIMSSFHMLPNDKSLRHLIYNMALKKKSEIHFAFEEIIADRKEVFFSIEDNFKYLDYTKNSKFIYENLKK